MSCKLLLLTQSCLLILSAGVSAGPGSGDKKPPVVGVSNPFVREVVDHEDFTGRTEAVEAVDVRSRVSGIIDKIYFKAGSKVRQGDLLFEIDPRRARADLDKAEAELKVLEARLKRHTVEWERAKRLLNTVAISREDVDKILADREEAEAALRMGRAGLERVKLDLEMTRIKAPIDGRISRPLLSVGNQVADGVTLLTNIVSSDPMYVFFDVDERSFLEMTLALRQGKMKDGSRVPVLMGLSIDSDYPHRGVLDFVNNRIDPKTGTIRMRAVFANPQEVLVPGLFARVRLVTSEPYKALLITEQAVRTDKGQRYVLVANAQNKVESRPVRLGAAQGGLRVIKEGLTPADLVLVSGLERVRVGMIVAPQRMDMPGQGAVPAPKSK